MPEPSGDSTAGDALRAIRADLERRNDAKKNLTLALASYLEQLPRDPMALPNSLFTLAEIWGTYTSTLYDSVAERYFAGSLEEPLALFETSGELFGGVTIAEVEETLDALKVQSPQNWPALDLSRQDDSIELQNTMRELAHGLATLPYSFSWLHDDEWFMGEITKRVRERAEHWRRKFEQRFAPASDAAAGAHAEPKNLKSSSLTRPGSSRPHIPAALADPNLGSNLRAEAAEGSGAQSEDSPPPAQAQTLDAKLTVAKRKTTDLKLQKKLLAVIRYQHYYGELKQLKQACKKHQTPALLKETFPRFDVWAALDDGDLKDVVDRPFDPGRFAWALVQRQLGHQGKDQRTLKNYKKDLKTTGLL